MTPRRDELAEIDWPRAFVDEMVAFLDQILRRELDPATGRVIAKDWDARYQFPAVISAWLACNQAAGNPYHSDETLILWAQRMIDVVVSGQDSQGRFDCEGPPRNYVEWLCYYIAATAEDLISYAGQAPGHRRLDQTAHNGKIGGGGTDSHLRYLLIESMQWVCQIPRYRPAFERAEARHGTNIARIIVARMLLRSLFKMLKDKVRFNQVRAA